MEEIKIEKYNSGMIVRKTYLLDNKKHRENSPADITYYDNYRNSKGNERYYKNDKLHREDGPAIIQYSYEGDIEQVWYYLNGIEITNELQIMVIEGLGMEKYLFTFG